MWWIWGHRKCTAVAFLEELKGALPASGGPQSNFAMGSLHGEWGDMGRFYPQFNQYRVLSGTEVTSGSGNYYIVNLNYGDWTSASGGANYTGMCISR